MVGSTNDVVRAWLADGAPEVCLAIADRQTAGRGRDGRTLDGAAWRGAAVVTRLPAGLAAPGASLAAGGGDVGGDGRRRRGDHRAGRRRVRLKWPNDLVVESSRRRSRSSPGVLGESDGIGSRDPRAVIGIGVNGDWAPDGLPDRAGPAR